MRNQLPAVVDEKLIAAEEDAVIDLQFLIQEMLIEKGLSRAELANRIGVSKARLSQLMRAEANPTFRTAARLFSALDEKMKICRNSRLRSVGDGVATASCWEEIVDEQEDSQQAVYARSWWKAHGSSNAIKIVHSNDDDCYRSNDEDEFVAA